MKNKTVFISGHLDLTQEEFDDNYKDLIIRAVDLDYNIVVGDARGTDTMAQQLLKDLGHKPVIVFHMFDEPRNNVGPFAQIGGFETDEERDADMTKNSDIDIAWVRPGREKSGTAKNIKRRKEYETQ